MCLVISKNFEDRQIVLTCIALYCDVKTQDSIAKSNRMSFNFYTWWHHAWIMLGIIVFGNKLSKGEAGGQLGGGEGGGRGNVRHNSLSGGGRSTLQDKSLPMSRYT